MNSIQARYEKFTVDYKDQLVPAHFDKQAGDCTFTDVLPQFNNESLAADVFKQARQTLLIACDQITDEVIIETLRDKADSGVRIYLLLGDAKVNQRGIDALSGRCLIRIGVRQNGVVILKDHATTQAQGLLLTDGRIMKAPDHPAWTIELEPWQIDNIHRNFCKLFWESCSGEYIKQNQQQAVVAHPEGDVLSNQSDQLVGEIENCIHESVENATGTSCAVFNLETHARQLLLHTDTPDIDKLAREGVALTERCIPSLILSTAGNWLLPNSVDPSFANWCLRLSTEQSEKLNSAYTMAMHTAAWQYQPDNTIGNISDGHFLRFTDRPEQIQSCLRKRTEQLRDIYTDSFKSFLSTGADKLAGRQTRWRRDKMAHEIEYEVRIQPPICPNAAIEDPLYSEWRTAENEWCRQVSALTEAQDRIDQQQAGIADQLRGFIKVFLLGETQSAKKLNQRLESLQGWSVTTATPAERIEYRKYLEGIQKSIEERGVNTVKSIVEAEQHQEWLVTKESLGKQHKQSISELARATEHFDQVRQDEPENLHKVNQHFSSEWAKAAELLTDQKIDLINIVGLNPGSGNLSTDEDCNSTAADKRKALSLMNIVQATEWKESVKAKIWNKHYARFEKVISHYELMTRKIEREIIDAESMVQRCRRVSDKLLQDLETHGQEFACRANPASNDFANQLGLTKNVASIEPFSWPDEELPHTGTVLYCDAKQRYLVISSEQQLSEAITDARRLNAKIVTQKEQQNA